MKTIRTSKYAANPLVKMMRERSMTIDELAAASGVVRGEIIRLRRGQHVPIQETAMALASALNCDATMLRNELLTYHDKPEVAGKWSGRNGRRFVILGIPRTTQLALRSYHSSAGQEICKTALALPREQVALTLLDAAAPDARFTVYDPSPQLIAHATRISHAPEHQAVQRLLTAAAIIVADKHPKLQIRQQLVRQ